MQHLRRATCLLVALLATGGLASRARPCSRVLWNDNGRSVLVGRNMDWFEDTGTNIWWLPRGMAREGLAPENPLRWTSQYASLALTGHDVVTVDGLNERGLAVHMLYLPDTSVAARDPQTPGLCLSLWAQYCLDQFATVAEAVAALKSQPYQLLMAKDPHSGKPVTVHLALNDPTGDSAVLECLRGEIKVYHSRDYTVMTNQPTFDLQLENLRRYRGFGGDQRLPGTHEPADRFIRSAYYVKNLPQPKSDREAVAALMSVMRNVSAPFGVSDPERPNVSTTIWRTITDLNQQVLYYDSVVSPQVFWVDIKKLTPAAGSPVLKLKVVENYDLMGDVSDQFLPADMFQFVPPE